MVERVRDDPEKDIILYDEIFCFFYLVFFRLMMFILHFREFTYYVLYFCCFFVASIYKFKCVMRKNLYSIVIECDVSRHRKFKIQSAPSSNLSWSDKDFCDAVRLVVDGKLHVHHVFLLCNNYIIKEFHVNLFNSKSYDKRTI